MKDWSGRGPQPHMLSLACKPSHAQGATPIHRYIQELRMHEVTTALYFKSASFSKLWPSVREDWQGKAVGGAPAK